MPWVLAISRELRGNADEIRYLRDTAHLKAVIRRTHRKKKIFKSRKIYQYIRPLLKLSKLAFSNKTTPPLTLSLSNGRRPIGREKAGQALRNRSFLAL